MVAESTVERMVDYCFNTPPDGLRSPVCVRQRLALIEANAALVKPVRKAARK
jgi:4-O-beta-D-mannosyl-D-glucose phosphorylase